MIFVEDSVRIERPIDHVFGFVSDPANDTRWQFDVLESETVSEGPTKVGSRIRSVVKFMGRRELDLEVARLEPNRLLEIQVHSGPPFGLRPTITYRLEPAGGGTTFTRSVRMQPTGAGRVMEPMMRAVAKRYSAKFLQTLKEVLERESGRP